VFAYVRNRTVGKCQTAVRCSWDAWGIGEVSTKHFIQHFHKYGKDWLCVSQATLERPQGRIQVASGTVLILGTTFMNVDLARMLEDESNRADARR